MDPRKFFSRPRTPEEIKHAFPSEDESAVYKGVVSDAGQLIYEPVKPPKPRTIVGETASVLAGALRNHQSAADTLEAEITAKTEALRQRRTVIRAIESAIMQVALDEALTADERALLGDVATQQVELELGTDG